VDRTPTDIPGIPEAATLVDDVHFRFERLPISGDVTLQSDPERFWMLAVADGTGRLRGTDTDIPLSTGSTILVPATAGEMQITDADNLVLLRMYVPGRPHAA
jgi:mannose-6-phosphate isomerase class I